MMRKKNLFIVALLALSFVANAAWAGKIEVDDTDDEETVITVNINICPRSRYNKKTKKRESPTKQDIQDFIDKIEPQTEAIWNACNKKFRIKKGAPAKRVRFDFVFTALEKCPKKGKKGAPKPKGGKPKAHLFKVQWGAPPSDQTYNANQVYIWLENSAKTIAHEIGHIMGLGEEYSRDRAVDNDNLMGMGNNDTIVPYHIMTVLAVYQGNPDSAEVLKRRSLRSALRETNKTKQAALIDQNEDITQDELDAFLEQFEVNDTTVQPAQPMSPAEIEAAEEANQGN